MVTKCASTNGAHCAEYKEELLATVKALTTPGKGILAWTNQMGLVACVWNQLAWKTRNSTENVGVKLCWARKDLESIVAERSFSQKLCIKTRQTAKRWWA